MHINPRCFGHDNSIHHCKHIHNWQSFVVMLSLLNVTWVLFYVNNLYLKIRQALQFKKASPPVTMFDIRIILLFILLKVIHRMRCNELDITLLETDILCLDRALVDTLVCKK